MIKNIKIIDMKNPNIEEIKFSNMQETMKYRNKLDEIITKEFNEFYSNPIRINNYDWSKVARTSYFNVSPRGLKQKEFIFEIFEMNNIERGEIATHYSKGKVLEQMIIKIKWI